MTSKGHKTHAIAETRDELAESELAKAAGGATAKAQPVTTGTFDTHGVAIPPPDFAP